MLFGKEIKDKLGATSSMYEENKKYTEKIVCETSSIESTLLFWS
jgi:hypothetical protein